MTVFSAGDVVRVWDRLVRPPNFKIHICVWPERQLFLRINSEANWPPHLLLKARDSSFLNHDSYVELQQFISLRLTDIDEAELLGHLSREQRHAIVQAVADGGWMSPDHTDMLAEKFA